MTTLNQPQTGTRRSQSRLRQFAPSLQTSERRWLLRLADLTLLTASLILAVVLRTELLPDASALISYAKWFITLWLTWLTIANIFDLYNLSRSAATAAIFAPVIAATAIAAFVYTAIPWLTPTHCQPHANPYLFHRFDCAAHDLAYRLCSCLHTPCV